MKTPYASLYWFLVLCMTLALACNLPTPNINDLPSHNEYSNPQKVTAEVDEIGIVHVAVRYRRGSDPQATLVCNYPGPDGMNTLQNSYVDQEPGTKNDLTKYYEFAFIVKNPGKYTVTCSIGPYSESGDFTIATPTEQPTESPTNTPPGGVELPKVGQFSSAGLWYYFETATSSQDGFFLQHCLPGVNYNDQGGYDVFKVAPDGTLSGECQFAYGNSLILSGKITDGRWTEDGKVTFHLESKAVANSSSTSHPGTSTTEVVWVGTGEFTSPTSATGTAEWRGTCTTNNPEWAPCGKAEYGSFVEANGTILWIINFGP